MRLNIIRDCNGIDGDSMRISVIIPVYNASNYIKACLNSVISQTYDNLDIILVDDGSNDGSAQICDSYLEFDKRIQVIHKENGGLSSARNAGLKAASGDYIFFLDADDLIAPHCLEYMAESARKSHADISSVALKTFFNESEIEELASLHKKPKFFESTRNVFYHQIVTNHSCGKLFKKSLFNDVVFPIRRNYEDISTSYLLFEKANIVTYTTAGLYFYRMRKGSISQSFSKKNINDLAKAFYEVDAHYKNTNNDDIRYYELTLLFTLFSRLNRCKEVHLTDINDQIRMKFDLYAKDIALRKYLKYPMTKKLILYKYHLATPFMAIYNCLCAKSLENQSINK